MESDHHTVLTVLTSRLAVTGRLATLEEISAALACGSAHRHVGERRCGRLPTQIGCGGVQIGVLFVAAKTPHRLLLLFIAVVH